MKLAVNIVTMLLSIFAFMLIGEGILRLCPGQMLRENIPDFEQKNIYVNNPNTGYKMAPNLNTKFQGHIITTDPFGFRKNVTSDDQLYNYTILAIGDSFTFGEGTEDKENYVAELAEYFKNKDRNPKINIINAGVPGFGTDQELEMLIETKKLTHPNLVLLTFYTGNDLIDNMIGGIKRRRVESNGFLYDRYIENMACKELKRNIFKLSLYKAGNFLEKRSLLFFLIKNRSELFLQKYFNWKVLDPYGYLDRGNFEFFRDPMPKKEEMLFSKTIKLITDIKEESEKSGAKFAVVIIPAGFQVYEEIYKGLIYEYKLQEKDYNIEGLNSKLAKYIAKANIPVLDLLPAFKNRKDMHLYRWGHLSPDGNSVATSEIISFLKQNNLIPSENIAN